jgi:hypothetical protein
MTSTRLNQTYRANVANAFDEPDSPIDAPNNTFTSLGFFPTGVSYFFASQDDPGELLRIHRNPNRVGRNPGLDGTPDEDPADLSLVEVTWSPEWWHVESAFVYLINPTFTDGTNYVGFHPIGEAWNMSAAHQGFVAFMGDPFQRFSFDADFQLTRTDIFFPDNIAYAEGVRLVNNDGHYVPNNPTHYPCDGYDLDAMIAWYVSPMEPPPVFVRYNPNYGDYLSYYFLHDYQLPDGVYTLESIYQVKYDTDVRKPAPFTREGYMFLGWSTIPNPGEGYTLISPDDNLALGSVGNLVPREEGGYYVNLYAQWEAIGPGGGVDDPLLIVLYNVNHEGEGGDYYFAHPYMFDENLGYREGDVYVVKPYTHETKVRSESWVLPPNYDELVFVGWNTAADRSGTAFAAGDRHTMRRPSAAELMDALSLTDSDIEYKISLILYAQWEPRNVDGDRAPGEAPAVPRAPRTGDDDIGSLRIYLMLAIASQYMFGILTLVNRKISTTKRRFSG